MNFKPELLDKILTGEKTQTRRIKKSGEKIWAQHKHRFAGEVRSEGQYGGKRRLKWAENSTYAACPGRGKPQQARITFTDIREQYLEDITEADARKEGFCSRAEFLEARDRINGKGKRDVFVFVITFRLEAR